MYNQDCIDGMKNIESGSVKLIVADPPYFLGMTHNGKRGSFVDLAICKPFFSELFAEFSRVLNNDGEVYWFSDWRGYAFYYPLFNNHLKVRNMIVWDKLSGPGSFYAFSHELIIYSSNNNRARKKGRNIWKVKGFNSGAVHTDGKKIHPTQKPVGLIEKIVLDGSSEGDLVVDPFSGSGTTALVARGHNRQFIGFELDTGNFEIARKRLTGSGVAIKL